MRRPWLVVVFLLSAALSLSWAQRGGMRGGFSPGRGFASHAGMHSGPVRTSSIASARAPRSGVRFGTTFRPDRDRDGFRRDGFRRHRFDRHFPRWYLSYGYPYYYGGYYPFFWDWWGTSYNSSDDDYAQRQTARQIDELSAEVERLREDREDNEPRVVYPQAPAGETPRPATDGKPDSDLPIVLVFLDQRMQEIKNYAVMNETLVVFDGARSRRIPLADVDLAATMKLNDERGVDFQIPN